MSHGSTRRSFTAHKGLEVRDPPHPHPHPLTHTPSPPPHSHTHPKPLNHTRNSNPLTHTPARHSIRTPSLTRGAHSLHVIDLNSTKGTYIDTGSGWSRLAQSVAAVLPRGGRVRLGECSTLLVFPHEGVAPAPPVTERERADDIPRFSSLVQSKVIVSNGAGSAKTDGEGGGGARSKEAGRVVRREVRAASRGLRQRGFRESTSSPQAGRASRPHTRVRLTRARATRKRVAPGGGGGGGGGGGFGWWKGGAPCPPPPPPPLPPPRTPPQPPPNNPLTTT